MTALVSAVLGLAAGVVTAPRWLRVAQREHYLFGSTTRFALRWWTRIMPNPFVVVIVVILVGLSWRWTVVGWVATAVAAIGPVGLSVRGRTSPLAWTGRLRRLAGVAAALLVASLSLGILLGAGVVAVGVMLIPVWIDLALAVLAPLERRAGDRWVNEAARGLERSGARVVAITGSYGKTSTKVIVAHVLGGLASTVASPASFNNRMGLARSINEGLAPGTEIFVAEMGTYGPGEIADLCSWIPPEVAVITALGPVHLERMRSVERIAQAKREILGRARVGVINIDHPLLESIAREESSRIRIVRCSAERSDVDVYAADGRVFVAGEVVAAFDRGTLHAGNVACAMGVVLGLDLDTGQAGMRLSTVPVPPNRQVVSTSAAGFVIIDDTFNSNPAGAQAALDRMAGVGGNRRVLVTPGMVELGAVQDEENLAMVRYAADLVTDLVVVGSTNRKALVEAAASAGLDSVIVTPTREDAVAWVREHLRSGDVVLYENDLPDHYP